VPKKKAQLTYMNPAPPVTSMFFASGNDSNLVLPINTGAFRHSSSVKYDLGLSIVDLRRPKRPSALCSRRVVEGAGGPTLYTLRSIGRDVRRLRALYGGHASVRGRKNLGERSGFLLIAPTSRTRLGLRCTQSTVTRTKRGGGELVRKRQPFRFLEMTSPLPFEAPQSTSAHDIHEMYSLHVLDFSQFNAVDIAFLSTGVMG
jgi:hypothetical protein